MHLSMTWPTTGMGGGYRGFDRRMSHPWGNYLPSNPVVKAGSWGYRVFDPAIPRSKQAPNKKQCRIIKFNTFQAARGKTDVLLS